MASLDKLLADGRLHGENSVLALWRRRVQAQMSISEPSCRRTTPPLSCSCCLLGYCTDLQTATSTAALFSCGGDATGSVSSGEPVVVVVVAARLHQRSKDCHKDSPTSHGATCERNRILFIRLSLKIDLIFSSNYLWKAYGDSFTVLVREAGDVCYTGYIGKMDAATGSQK